MTAVRRARRHGAVHRVAERAGDHGGRGWPRRTRRGALRRRRPSAPRRASQSASDGAAPWRPRPRPRGPCPGTCRERRPRAPPWCHGPRPDRRCRHGHVADAAARPGHDRLQPGAAVVPAATTGALVARRGAGGLVSGLAPLVVGTDGEWVAAAMSDGDRAAGAEPVIEADGLHVRLLGHRPRRLPDGLRRGVQRHPVVRAPRPLRPGPTPALRPPLVAQAWDAYRRVNDAFADAVADDAPEGRGRAGAGLPPLPAGGRCSAERRPDLRTCTSRHTPFAHARLLRGAARRGGRASCWRAWPAHHACGFHSAPLGRRLRRLRGRGRSDAAAATFVAPLAPDPDDLAAVAAIEACAPGRRTRSTRASATGA